MESIPLKASENLIQRSKPRVLKALCDGGSQIVAAISSLAPETFHQPSAA